MSDSTLIVGAIDLNDGTNTELLSMTLGKPSRASDEYAAPLADLPAFGPVNTSAAVESHFVVKVKDSSVPALLARVAAIAAAVRDLLPITVALAGSSQLGTILPRQADCLELPLEEAGGSRIVNALWTFVELVVLRDPWIYGPAHTLASDEGHDLPTLVSLAAMTGLAPAPIESTFTPPGSDFRAFYAGVYPDDTAVVADFVRELAATTWTGSTSAAADAAGWPAGAGNTVRTTTSDTLVTTSVDTFGLLPGEYLVVVNHKLSAGAGTVYAGASPVEAEMQHAAAGGTTLGWLPVGVVSLPAQAARGAGAAPLYIGMKSDGAATLAVNAVAFVPTTWGMMGWRHPSSHCHELVYEAGAVYADGVPSYRYATGSRRVRALGGVLVAIAGPSSSPAPTHHVHFTMAYTPRWEQLP